ncbi:MAG: hypothetical protein LBC89_01525, partial [Bacteroidales bacterium]|nr:hypothetical protein [Bacteroidales bacterium]
ILTKNKIKKYSKINKMKTKIKYIAIILTTIALATAVIFVACKKQNKTPNTDSDVQQFVKMAQEGAIVHNEGLNYIYEKLLETVIQNDVMTVVEDLTIEFIESHPFFQSNINSAIILAKHGIEIIRQNRRDSDTKLWFEESEERLSNGQKTWLLLINDAIDQNEDIDQLIKTLDQIKENVLKEGNDEEIFTTVIAIETGKETLRYWYNHLNEWARFAPEMKRWSWKQMARADLKGVIDGAIGGAIGGALAGGLAGAASGALAGAAGYGVASSASNAIGQLTGWW